MNTIAFDAVFGYKNAKEEFFPATVVQGKTMSSVLAVPNAAYCLLLLNNSLVPVLAKVTVDDEDICSDDLDFVLAPNSYTYVDRKYRRGVHGGIPLRFKGENAVGKIVVTFWLILKVENQEQVCDNLESIDASLKREPVNVIQFIYYERETFFNKFIASGLLSSDAAMLPCETIEVYKRKQ
jgi:hypothetical protein